MSYDEPTAQRAGRGARWTIALVVSLAFTALLWAVEIVDQAVYAGTAAGTLDAEGIVPRTEDGLTGILAAPLLHAGWRHLEANTVPTLVLFFLVLAPGLGRGLLATAIIWLVAGVGVWALAPPGEIHLGASSLVFGWFTYLILRGFFVRSAGQITLGIVLFLLYGGLLWGVLPGQPGVSWQGHLFGAVGGVLAAMWLRGRSTPRRTAQPVAPY